MSGLEKILEEIHNEAQAEAQLALAKAHAEADEIISLAKKEGGETAAAVLKNAEAEVQEAERSLESAKRLQRRRQMLVFKQEIIAETLAQAQQALLALPDDAYFALLAGWVKKKALAEKGVLCLNEKDKARLPADFLPELLPQLPKGAALEVGEAAVPIDGGFILQYGDLAENCSVEALFNANADAFSDIARGALFDE